jgi:predicted chitinase
MRLKEFSEPTAPLEPSGLGNVLERTAKAAGIVGVELAQLLAQCHVETAGYQTLKELPNKWQKHYEPPSKTASMLGNTQRGDGQKFLGRGFIQVTGRYNYNQFAQNSGIDVINHPELLEKPETAAKATVDFWLNRVRPNVRDMNNTSEVTRLVNNAKKHVGERIAAFKQYANKLPAKVKPASKPVTAQPQATTKPSIQKTAQTAPQQPKKKDDLDAFLKLKGLG